MIPIEPPPTHLPAPPASGAPAASPSLPPPPSSGGEITGLIRAWRGGNAAARDELFRVIEPELRRLARVHLKGQGPNCSQQTGDLINEMYCKLEKSGRVTAESRGQFFSLLATIIRRLLIDWARARDARRHGGQLIRVGMEKAETVPAQQEAMLVAEILALDQALEKLQGIRPDLVEVVNLIHFGGCEVKETAAILGLSEPQVRRRWNLALAWLARELSGGNHAVKGVVHGTGLERAA